jgi:hypothetical protein
MRGDPAPRGGERKQPNPIFLAHAAALTELYVTLTTQAGEVELALQEYRREGDAREPFTHLGKERALAPDATVILIDADGRQFGAFVEIDLGTMSHTRLRQKADLYAAYTESEAWHKRHLFLPALLFLTTTDIRAGRFLKALAGSLSYGFRRQGRRAFVAGAAGVAWAPHRLLDGERLADLDGRSGLALTDVLSAARAPYEKAVAREREQREADDEKRRWLHENPREMRRHLSDHKSEIGTYLKALGGFGEQALALLLASTSEPSPKERTVLGAIAHDLGEGLPDLWASKLPDPGAMVTSEAQSLAERYREIQTEQVRMLAEQYGNLPSVLRAWGRLRGGGLLDHAEVTALPRDTKRDAASRVKQHELATAYIAWRDQTARQLARNTGPLGRLTHREEFYDQLDGETLKNCRHCHQTIYPPAKNPHSYEPSTIFECHYCHDNYGMDPYRPASITSKEAH